MSTRYRYSQTARKSAYYPEEGTNKRKSWNLDAYEAEEAKKDSDKSEVSDKTEVFSASSDYKTEVSSSGEGEHEQRDSRCQQPC